MSTARPTPDPLTGIQALAARWGEVIARRMYGPTGPGRDIDLATLEQVALADSVKGIFHGPFGQQLGYGDTVGKRQLIALEGINKNAAVLPDMAKGVNGLVNALQFK